MGKIRLGRLLLGAVVLIAATDASFAQTGSTTLAVRVLLLEQTSPPRPTLSNLLPPVSDAGVAGARLGAADNNTTGRFLQHHYAVTFKQSQHSEELLRAAQDWLKDDNHLILAKLPGDTLRALLALPGIAESAIVFNVGNPDDDLRQHHCQARLLHTLPSRAMLTDALAQFLVAKRWPRWLMLQGQYPEDALFAQAMLRSATRFGGKIIETRRWNFNADLRRSAQKELALFSQARDYDVTLVADESGDIGEFVPYNTWLPRPTAGTQGLTPTAWHWTIEQWGAAQLQNRFRGVAKRNMTDLDFAAWLAMRVIGEAVTRQRSSDADTLYRYLLSEQFEISAFMGRRLNFRDWNGQLRLPIALVQPHAMVSQSPQEGYLHPHSELDTLGFDRAEVDCAFGPPTPAGES